jgi:hypothetical protein
MGCERLDSVGALDTLIVYPAFTRQAEHWGLAALSNGRVDKT